MEGTGRGFRKLFGNRLPRSSSNLPCILVPLLAGDPDTLRGFSRTVLLLQPNDGPVGHGVRSRRFSWQTNTSQRLYFRSEQTLKRVPFDPLFKCQSLQVTPASSADGSLGRPTNDASHSHTATAMTMTTRARSGAARAAAGAALALVLALALSGAAAGARLGEKGARPSELRVMPG